MKKRFCILSLGLFFSFSARRALGLGKSAAQAQFWAGILIGVAAQALVVLPITRFVVSWWTLVLAAASGWVVFFLVRVIFRMLSPEEARLLDPLRKVIFFPSHKR